MLLELKIFMKDGTVAHDLISCDKPEDFDKVNCTNIKHFCEFQNLDIVNNPVVKIEKKCVLGCKTKMRFTGCYWISGGKYEWPAEWWKMI